MKLIIAGATGFVGAEVVRQALLSPDITSVVALARKPVSVPDGEDVDASKLKSVVIQDYGSYPDDVMKEFAGADACIWTVAVTPGKMRSMNFAEVRRVCHDCTLAGLNAMCEAGPARPFRFLYMSGHNCERDQEKRPPWLSEYLLMRGRTENEVLAIAAKRGNNELQVCVAKPGLISKPGAVFWGMVGVALKYTIGMPSITTAEIVAAMLQQVIGGFEKEPLMNDDMVEIGRKALSKR